MHDKLRSVLENSESREELCKRTGFACPTTDPQEVLKVYKSRRQGGQMPDPATLEPVVLFPGLAGSSLEAEIDKDYKPSWTCWKEASWWNIWISLYEALFQTCWFDNLKVNYDPLTNSYHNQPGVKLRPRDFGGLGGVDYLDHTDDPLKLTAYYAPIIDALKTIGYVAGTNIFGAPYDWRVPVDFLFKTDILGTNQTYFNDVKQLIERAYVSAGNRPAHLVAHSMGCPSVLYFLNRMSLDWKDKYVKSFVPIAGPFAGTLKALKTMMSGDNLGLQIPLLDISILSEKDISNMMRGSGGAGYLIPDADYYHTQVFVTNTALGKNYSASDFGAMWEDMNDHNASIMWSKTKDLISEMTHPEVESFCLYGYGIATELHLTYSEAWPTDPTQVIQPKVDYTDLGDGTIGLFSLSECKNWIDLEHTTHPVNCREYNLVGHAAILKDVALHADLLEIVTGVSDISGCADIDTPKYVAAVEEVKRYQ